MSIRKREWVTAKGETKSAWVVNYTDQAGKRRLKTFAKKKEADEFAATAKVEVMAGKHVAESATITVAKAGEHWLEAGKAAGLEATTLDQRRQHLRLHIEPFLGREKLTRLTVPAIRSWQDRLRAEGRSPGMIRRATVSLGGILGEAVDRGLAATNAVRTMSRRTAKNVERRQKRRLEVGVDIPTNAEVRAIVAAASGRYRPLVLTLLFTGLRSSELRGLRWQDVELDRGVLHVRQRTDRYLAQGAPKSASGRRTLPLPPLVVNALREWRLACPRREGDLDLVFPTGAGRPEHHANVISRAWKPTQVAAGVTVPTGERDEAGQPILAAKYSGLHAARHWHASWLINRRADGGQELLPKAVQTRLGHSSIQVTMDTYAHLFPSTDEAAAMAEAERALFSPVNTT